MTKATWRPHVAQGTLTEADSAQAFANIKAAKHYGVEVSAETWQDLASPSSTSSRTTHHSRPTTVEPLRSGCVQTFHVEEPTLPFASAMRGVAARGYRSEDFRADLGAGINVGIVALPLSMALAIASGAPPQLGLFTVIVGGAVVAPW